MYFFRSSAADHEASKHKVEGDAFIRGRAAFREQFAGRGDSKISKKEKYDRYVANVTSDIFQKLQDEKNTKSSYGPNAVDKEGKCTQSRLKPNRVDRTRHVGHSYADWTEGSDNGKSGGKSVIIIIVFMTLLAIIIRKLT